MSEFSKLSAPPAGLPTPHRVTADRGWHWLLDAFARFKQQAGLWIVLWLIYVIILAALSSMATIGFVGQIIAPILFGGLVLGCLAQEEGEEIELGHLFAGFKRNTGQLALVGVISLVLFLIAAVIAVAPLAIMGGTGIVLGLAAGKATGMATSAGLGLALGALLALLLFFALIVPITMATWFASALVMLNDAQAWDAMKLSFSACWLNVMPFTVYGLVVLVLGVLAMIPLGLGLLILGPVLLISGYTSYKDVFGR